MSHVQWRHRDELTANNYNPNRVAPPERELLIISILESGWTQPLVATPDMEIVDGYHRWLVSADLRVYKLTRGFVPVVLLHSVDRASQQMATIRHNRARGTHAVLEMSTIIQEMLEEQKLSMQEICARLQMDEEEVVRLAIRLGIPQSKIIRDTDWSSEWVPAAIDT